MKVNVATPAAVLVTPTWKRETTTNRKFTSYERDSMFQQSPALAVRAPAAVLGVPRPIVEPAPVEPVLPVHLAVIETIHTQGTPLYSLKSINANYNWASSTDIRS